ncbi:sugar phosphate permease [Desulfitobacterium dichloroeliminans LMG P-21439]|uniref:Sugar phosphate permease n=1 Tax=Desulfitobacterium dichloroeliminans (strain LMG P-21439 / DCA1) TaxID=871963 RepID=L0F5A1_DESDL|nr:MFS transporter [Desulfitobacterium dichloroeliminans]AGA68994.1 sugar phosphate permease [Desulfitobacterium dichloroeliminans LMG P-21439]
MKKNDYGYAIIVGGFIVWLTAWGTYSTFGVFVKPIIDQFEWERADIALAYSLSTIVQAICALGMGKLTDKLGPRLVVTVFGSFLALAYLLLSRVTVLWQYQFVYIFVGSIGLSTATVPIMTTIARWFVKNRGTVSGIVQSGMGIGGLIFSPLVGWLIVNYDWRTAYLILSYISLPLIVISGLLLRRDPGRLSNSQGENREKSTINQDAKKPLEVGLSLRRAISTGQFWMIAVMFLSFGFCRCTFLAHTATHVQDLGYSLTEGANVMAVLTFSSIIGRVGVGFLADKIGCRNAYFISFCTMGVALIWGGYTRQLWGLFLFATLFGISWGGQAVLRFTFSAEMFGLVALGVITGVLGLTEASGAAFGSFFAGYVFDLVGSYDIMFVLGIVLSVLGGIMSYFIKPIKIN